MSPQRRGKVRTKSGKNEIKRITKISTAKKGSISLESPASFSPEIEEETKRTKHIGGVAKPTVTFTHITMEK